MTPWRGGFVLVLSALTIACSHSNNLLLGEVRGKLASHEVVVTDCYRTSVPHPTIVPTRQSWEPCRDASIVIDGEQLAVNGKDCGKLSIGDSVLVDHGVVSVQRN
jgi:hypothetical protein